MLKRLSLPVAIVCLNGASAAPAEVVDELQAGVDVAPPRIGNGQAVEQLAPACPKRSETGHGCPKVISVAWMRCFSVVRWRTKCSR
jgi:hypothetical protein